MNKHDLTIAEYQNNVKTMVGRPLEAHEVTRIVGGNGFSGMYECGFSISESACYIHGLRGAEEAKW